MHLPQTRILRQPFLSIRPRLTDQRCRLCLWNRWLRPGQFLRRLQDLQTSSWNLPCGRDCAALLRNPRIRSLNRSSCPNLRSPNPAGFRLFPDLATDVIKPEVFTTCQAIADSACSGPPTVQSRPLRITRRYNVSRSTGILPASRIRRCS